MQPYMARLERLHATWLLFNDVHNCSNGAEGGRAPHEQCYSAVDADAAFDRSLGYGKFTDTTLIPPWARPCDCNAQMLRIPEHTEPRTSVHQSFCCRLELTHVGAM